ncbi:MAG: thiol:disulfide interchange protein DsbA/DsbL [Proteobacteria bacterium]|nr:thiol:disulfide interchange protein DsbA/DsbL [Pseudomonadota bacterium]
MQRRAFSLSLVGVTAGIAAPAAALAAQAQAPAVPVEGTHYVRLNPPAPTGAAGKIEVVEFFWYGSPHCSALEPALEAWRKRLGPDVAFRRVPVALYGDASVAQQRLYYALDALGQLPAMHRRIFYAIHSDRARFDKLPEIAAFMAKNNVDATRFNAAYESPAVQAQARQASLLSDAYKIDSVPAFGVQGRYYTSATLAGSGDKALTVTDFLIARARRGA